MNSVIRSFFTGALLLTICAVSVDAGVYRRANGKQIKGRYIVMFEPGTADVPGLAAALTRAHGGRLLGTMTHAMLGFAAELPEGAARALARNLHVAMVEEDEEAYLAATPEVNEPPFDFTPALAPVTSDAIASYPHNGSYYLCQYANDLHWNLDRLDNLGPIYSYKAYAYTRAGTGVRVYVVDTGVHAQHAEFTESGTSRVTIGATMLLDPDVSDAPQRTDEEQGHYSDSSPANFPCGQWTADWYASHGTAVASVVAGHTTGVAKNATIVPVKVYSCNSSSISKLAIARGLDWIAQDMSGRSGRAVVNMSIYIPPNEFNQVCEDGSGGYVNCTTAVEHEINQLIGQNIPVVVSANNQNNGNCATTPARMGYGGTYPSTHRTITVGGTMYTGTNYTDRRWECQFAPGGCDPAWTNTTTGEGMGSNFGSCVSIWAPAWNVRVAYTTSSTAYRPAGGPSSGTSFAAPYVAGAVARLLENYPWLTPQQVWQELASRADQRGTNVPDFDPSGVTNRRLVYMSPWE